MLRRTDPSRRLRLGALCMAFVLSLFVGRLVQLQGIESAAYKVKAERERTIAMTLPATRGELTDSGGRPLAMTIEARALYADPAHVDPAEVPRIVSEVSRLTGVSGDDVQQRITHPSSKRFTYLAHGVTPPVAEQIVEMNFKGIGAQREYKRVYPDNQVAANVVGVVGSDQHGLVGLEYSEDKTLAGRDGSQRVEIGLRGQAIPMAPEVRKDPVPGHGLKLTLDRDIQWKAEQALAAQVKKTKAKSGTIIVMDPRTGSLVALAATPTFDPNNLDTLRSWNTTNRAVTDVYEPGSTNKVITAAAAIERGGVRPNTPFTVPGGLSRGGTTFHDSEPHGTEHLTFAGVLAKSSNIGTILASEKVDKQTLYQYMRNFGFGATTNIGLPGESSGLLPALNRWSATSRYTIAFGQGVSVNAIQMASVYATIANGGVRVAPTLIAGQYDGHGGYDPTHPRQRRVITAETARRVERMLEGVTAAEGTAPEAQIPGYRVAGKTGTAQRVDSTCGCYRGYTSSFVGFAPAENPQLVAQVVLQDPKTQHYGGAVAAPVFKDVMSFALKSRKIPPSGSKSPKLPIYAK
jgi:cell division protein FtsI (penicillin-binding protein 3)